LTGAERKNKHAREKTGRKLKFVTNRTLKSMKVDRLVKYPGSTHVSRTLVREWVVAMIELSALKAT